MIEHSFFRPLPVGAFDLVTIDYPWPWETWAESGRKKSPQYDCMSIAEIERTNPQDLLSPRGVAFFYCTWPLLPVQSRVIADVFGLEIKTGGVWVKTTVNDKERWGPGHILRSVCEPYLIAARKGHKMKGPSEKNLIEAFDHKPVRGLAREHSRKPEEIYQMLERLTPGWRRADLFSRQSRDGWTTWGREKTKFDRK